MDLFAAQASLHTSLDYYMSRHNLLVSNVAHVDTPGYVPRDLHKAQDASSPFGVVLKRTQENHLSAFGTSGASDGGIFYDRSAGAGRDRNYVSLDREAAKLAANQSRYDVVSTMLAAEYSQLAYAANDGAGA